MPCEFRLLQLGGEAFSLDIPLYRITGREFPYQNEWLPSESRRTRLRRRFYRPYI
jgi:hypothetical protein